MEKRQKGNGFRHPKLRLYGWNYDVIPSIRHPPRGLGLPFLKVTLPPAVAADLLLIGDTRRLFWNTLTKAEPHLFGVFETPGSPWLVVELDNALTKWTKHSLACGLWVLELSAGEISVVSSFCNHNGDRIDIDNTAQFLGDFSYSFTDERQTTWPSDDTLSGWTPKGSKLYTV